MPELLFHISGALPNVDNFRLRLLFACDALDVTLHGHPDRRRGGGPCGNNGAGGKICHQLHQSDLHGVERTGLSACDEGRTCRKRQRDVAQQLEWSSHLDGRRARWLAPARNDCCETRKQMLECRSKSSEFLAGMPKVAGRGRSGECSTFRRTGDAEAPKWTIWARCVCSCER